MSSSMKDNFIGNNDTFVIRVHINVIFNCFISYSEQAPFICSFVCNSHEQNDK